MLIDNDDVVDDDDTVLAVIIVVSSVVAACIVFIVFASVSVAITLTIVVIYIACIAIEWLVIIPAFVVRLQYATEIRTNYVYSIQIYYLLRLYVLP